MTYNLFELLIHFFNRTFRSFRGRGFGFGRGFGGWSGGWHGRGGHWGGGGGGRPLQQETAESSGESDEVYETVLSEALADNVDLEEATARAEAAKQTATAHVEAEHLEEDDQTLTTLGIEVTSEPGRGRGKVYRGRCNAANEGTMKAQRGRRGLISHGELIPDKLSKSQKKAQPKDIATFLAQKTAEAGLETSCDVRRHAPLLMNFVKGGVMEGNQ